ncbi:ORF53 [callitrichine gammaherpesvirus 3]|uniref:ORF53 n=1 Tax=callitrichine gammaherpesvirus 3 TaxID=106331 RepID=Q993F6_9GAMA|nr:ORF53 [callitrichine gammaherpesvirus 3]AAK38262.1 ORF53 [callitrichine gammaherpesvirus 3]
METTQSLVFVPGALATLSKCYEHVQTHLKTGIIQVSLVGSLNSAQAVPRFILSSNMLQTARLQFEVTERAIAEWHNHQNEADSPATLSVRNMAYGRTFLLARELFSHAVKEASFKFYRKTDGGPQFVRMILEYDDLSTMMHHTAVLEPYVAPFGDALSGERLVGRVLLSPKTTMGLQKFTRVRGAAPVRITLNPDLYVLTCIGEDDGCHTVDYKPVSVPARDSFATPITKAIDSAAADSHVMSRAAANALCTALGLCRIPGVSVPILNFYESGLLCVSAALLTTASHLPLDLRVVLFNPSYKNDGDVHNPEAVKIQEEWPIRATVSPKPCHLLTDISQSPPVCSPPHQTPLPALNSITEPQEFARCVASTFQRKRNCTEETVSKQKKPSKKLKLSFNPLI